MKIKINKEKFNKHLENISRAVNSNLALPSLQGILITATESNLQLLASNGNLSIKEVIELNDQINVQEPGVVLVPGVLFKNVISKLEGDILLIANESTINIDSNNNNISLQLMNPTEYPQIGFETIGKELILDSDSLKEIIKNVSFAAGDNDKRIILNGVNLKSKDGYLKASATNSFRLAQESVEVDSNVDFDITILSKNLKDFLPNDITGPITINVNDSKIITKYKTTTIMSKLIDGIFPDLSRLIPNEFKNILKIDSKVLNKAINQVTVVAEENKKIIKFTVSGNELKLESKRREMGDSLIKINEFEWKGDDFTIVMNAQFLQEALNKFNNKIVIAFNGQYDPFVIKGESNPKLTQLILPHRSY